MSLSLAHWHCCNVERVGLRRRSLLLTLQQQWQTQRPCSSQTLLHRQTYLARIKVDVCQSERG